MGGVIFTINLKTPQTKVFFAWRPATNISGGVFGLFDRVRKVFHSSSGGVTYGFVPEFGNALNYASGYIRVYEKHTLAGLTNWTITAWVITTSLTTSGGNGRPIYSERSTGNELLKFQLSDGVGAVAGGLQYIYRDTAGTLNRAGMASALSANTLYHVALVKTGTDIRIYVNAVQAYNNTLTATDTLTTITRVEIGGDSAGSSVAWAGMIPDTRAYGRALSISELWQHYDPATRFDLYQPIALPGLWLETSGGARSYGAIF